MSSSEMFHRPLRTTACSRSCTSSEAAPTSRHASVESTCGVVFLPFRADFFGLGETVLHSRVAQFAPGGPSGSWANTSLASATSNRRTCATRRELVGSVAAINGICAESSAGKHYARRGKFENVSSRVNGSPQAQQNERSSTIDIAGLRGSVMRLRLLDIAEKSGPPFPSASSGVKRAPLANSVAESPEMQAIALA